MFWTGSSKDLTTDQSTAFNLQLMGAREGLIKGLTIGAAVISLANYNWPLLRRQTLPFKCFLAMGFMSFGIFTHADHYLLHWEHRQGNVIRDLRQLATSELQKNRQAPSEQNISAWLRKYHETQGQANAATSETVQEVKEVEHEKEEAAQKDAQKEAA